MDRKTPLIIITGPTASGKTGLALNLAKTHPIEAVSADSMQVYRHMDIATAKPSKKERVILPHHVIDVVEPDQEFNAGMFASIAGHKITSIRSRGNIPVVIGGTGLYIKALAYGLAEAPPRSEPLRKSLFSLIEARGLDLLWRLLYANDAPTAGRISPNDASRIIRYLEIILLTGKKPSDLYRDHGFTRPLFDIRAVCIMPERDSLYRDIDKRVISMMDAGLVGETEKLLEMGFSPGLRSMQTLAYRHTIRLLNRDIPHDQAVSLIQRDTRRYAKRQMTWLRSNYGPECLFDSPDKAMPTLSGWLEGTQP